MGEGPVVVFEGLTVLRPLVVAAKVVVHGVVALDGLRGVHVDRSVDGFSIGIARLGQHILGTHVHLEVILEEGRVEVQTGRIALEVGGFQNTLLSRVTQTEAVRHRADTTGKRHVVVVGHSRTIDLVLPVGVGSAQSLVGIGAFAIVGLHKLTEGIAVHHVDGLVLLAHGDVAVVGHLGLHAGTALLGGDDNDTVRTAAAIDGRGRSVLEHSETFDVGRVDHRERIGKSLHAAVVHRQSINDDERVVGGVERRTATDADAGTGTGATAVGRDVHTGNLALNHVLGIDHNALVLFVGLDGRHRTGHVAFLRHAITDDHSLTEGVVNLFEHDVQRTALPLHLLAFIADVGDAEGGSGLNIFEYETAIVVHDHDTIVRTFHLHRCTDEGHACGIFHNAFDHAVLLHAQHFGGRLVGKGRSNGERHQQHHEADRLETFIHIVELFC